MHHNDRGFTLIEVLLAMALFAMVMGVAYGALGISSGNEIRGISCEA